jgi:hypothetical protein
VAGEGSGGGGSSEGAEFKREACGGAFSDSKESSVMSGASVATASVSTAGPISGRSPRVSHDKTLRPVRSATVEPCKQP